MDKLTTEATSANTTNTTIGIACLLQTPYSNNMLVVVYASNSQAAIGNVLHMTKLGIRGCLYYDEVNHLSLKLLSAFAFFRRLRKCTYSSNLVSVVAFFDVDIPVPKNNTTRKRR